MAHVIVIGYGNPLRGDDGLGWEMARRLEREFSDPRVCVFAQRQLTPELAEPVSRAQVVVLIDAAQDGEPGTIRCVEVQPVWSPEGQNPRREPRSGAGVLESAGERARPCEAHDMDAPTLLGLSLQLFGRAPRALLLTATGAWFGFHEGLSSTMLQAVPELLARARRYIQEGCDARSLADPRAA